MRTFILSFGLLAALTVTAHAEDKIGFRQITITDDNRPLAAAIWYPTIDDRTPTIVAGNAAFQGVAVIKDATATSGPHALVVLSHGFGGTWRNPSWLAAELVDEGYVVAAVDHPGTTAFDRDPEKAAMLWERPRDVRRLIDALLADRSLDIDDRRIAAIGHSLGGWTVAELAGARFDAGRVTEDCETRFGAMACTLFAKLGIGRDALSTRKLAQDMGDARVGAVVTLDLGLARGFTPESLSSVRTPFLVIAAGSDIAPDEAAKGEVAATNKDSRYLAQYLPKAITTYAEIAGALHFSFLQICKPGAIDLIEAEAPGEGIVCKDKDGRDRAAIHREVADMIIAHLAKSLPSH